MVKPPVMTALHDGDLLVCEYMNHRLQCLDHRNACLWTLGERGSGDGQFDFPEHMLLVRDATRLFVVDSNNHRIQVFEQEEEGGSGGGARGGAGDPPASTVCGSRPRFVFQASLGAQGKGDGEFRHPRAIAIDGTGKLFVTDCDNHRVVVLAPNLQFAGAFCSHGTGAGQLSHPHGIAVDSRDLVYVADTHNARVSVFTNAMEPVLAIAEPSPSPASFLEPYGLTFDEHTSRLFVSDRGKHCLQLFSVDPGPLLQTNPSYRHARTVGAKGWRKGQFNYPYGMCVDADGDLYVADGFNHRVGIFHGRECEGLTTLGGQGARLGQFSYPIAVYKSGSGHFSEEGNHAFEPVVPHSKLLMPD